MSSVQKASVTENRLQALVLKPVRESSGACFKVLSEGEYLIGSARHCDFQLPFDGIAPEHCKLEYDGNRAVLHAIDSRVWVNDGPAHGISLRRKDRVSIGPVNFLFEHAQSEPAGSAVSNSVDEDLIQAENDLLQSLQRAIARGQIEPHGLAALNPETKPAESVESGSVESEKSLDELHQAIGQSQKQQAEHREALSRIQQESSEKIEELQKQIAEQRQTSQRHELALSEKKCEIEQLTNQFETRIAQLTAREQELQETLAATKEKEKEWHTREQKYLAEQKDFEQQLKSIEEKLVETTNRLSAEQVSVLERQFQQEKKAWEQEREKLESELRKSREDREELEQQVQELRDEIEVAQAQVRERDEQITTLQDRTAEIQQELQELEERFQQEKEKTEQLQQQLEQAVEVAREQQQEWDAAIERAEKEREAAIEELKLAHEQEVSELDSLRAMIEQKNAETESLQQELNQLLEQQADLQEQKLKSAAELEKIEAAREDLEAEKEAFTQARKDIQALREEVEQERLGLKQELEAAEAESASAEQKAGVEQKAGLEQEEEKYAASPQEEAIESEILTCHQADQISSAQASEELGNEEIDCEQAIENEVPELDSAPEEAICSGGETEVEEEQDGVSEKVESLAESLVEPSQEESDSENQQTLDLDFGELGSVLNGIGSPEDSDTIEESAEGVSLDGRAEEADLSSVTVADEPEVAPSEIEACDDGNPCSEAESEDATQESVLELRSELAKMFGLDQTEQSDGSGQQMDPVQQMDEVVEESSEYESVEPSRDVESSDVEEVQKSDEAETESLFGDSLIEQSAQAEEAAQDTSDMQQDISDSSEVTEVDIEDPDSISAYMKALFERTSGKQDYCELDLSSRPVKEKSVPVKVDEPAQQMPVTAETVAEQAEEETVPAKPQGPIARVDKESVAQEIASLRDVANQTARSALCTYTWKKLRMKVLMNGILVVSGGVASAVLLTAPLWGSQSYAGYGVITLFLSAISAVELIRANMMVVRLKTGISQTKNLTANDECEVDE